MQIHTYNIHVVATSHTYEMLIHKIFKMVSRSLISRLYRGG